MSLLRMLGGILRGAVLPGQESLHGRGHRRLLPPPAVERLEDRLCLSHAWLLVIDGDDPIRGGSKIVQFDGTTGAFINVWVPTSGGGLNRPDYGVTRGPDNNLYVGSVYSDTVERYDGNDGSPLPAQGPGADFTLRYDGGLRGAEGIAFGGPDGNLFVGNDRTGGLGSPPGNVLIFDKTTGEFIREFVPAGDSGMDRTGDLHFGPDGHLYVSSADTHQILRYDENTGAALPGATRSGANFIDPNPGGNPDWLSGFTWDADGNLDAAVTTYDSSSSKILKFDGVTGDLLGVFIPPSPSIGYVNSMVWEDNFLYVTNYSPAQGPSSILTFDSAGNLVGTFATAAPVNIPVGLIFWDPPQAAPPGSGEGGRGDRSGADPLLVFTMTVKSQGDEAPLERHPAIAAAAPSPPTAVAQRVATRVAGQSPAAVAAGPNLRLATVSALRNARDNIFAQQGSTDQLPDRLRQLDADLELVCGLGK